MAEISDTARPTLAGKARLKWDAVREKHLLLFPEGVLVLNSTAHDVLALCDGRRTVREIIGVLAAEYSSDAIAGDVREILGKLRQRTFVTLDE